MPRCARIVVPGIAHHLTQRGNRRQRVFFDDEDRLLFLEKLSLYAGKAGMNVASYCLMPNHTHLIVVPECKNSLSRALKPLHMFYSQHLNRRFKHTGLNWQGRFFSAPLDAEHTWRAFQYVCLNPVRANLVRVFQNYRWSSALAHLQMTNDPVLTANSDWLHQARKAIQAPYKKGDSLDEEYFSSLRRNTFMNLPIGSDDFVQELEIKFNRRLMPRTVGRPPKTEIG